MIGLSTEAPNRIDMIQELRDAVGLFAGAMPTTPKQAWQGAIVEVERIREIATQGYCWACEEKAKEVVWVCWRVSGLDTKQVCRHEGCGWRALVALVADHVSERTS